MRDTRDGQRQVLLGRKKRGLGSGKIVGIGGKIDPGETPIEATVREIAEEVRLTIEPAELKPMATIIHRFETRPQWDQWAAVYVCDTTHGDAEETDEIEPIWFDINDVPYHLMWDDARFWLPSVLENSRIEADFLFAADCETVIKSASARLN